MTALVCCHDDFAFLNRATCAVLPIPCLVLVSRKAWNGTEGDWERCASIAREKGCEVLVGDWEDEASHRRAALDAARERGHQWALILDTDEVLSPELLDSLTRIAEGNVADRVRVMMETYWKSPDYAIRPRERLNPIVLINLAVVEHHHIREYTGGRELVLSEDFGLLHHLSYAGPDERILRKLTTWSHRDEVVPNWFHQIWQGWDRNRQLRDLHPTHPFAYGMTERVVPRIRS